MKRAARRPIVPEAKKELARSSSTTRDGTNQAEMFLGRGEPPRRGRSQEDYRLTRSKRTTNQRMFGKKFAILLMTPENVDTTFVDYTDYEYYRSSHDHNAVVVLVGGRNSRTHFSAHGPPIASNTTPPELLHRESQTIGTRNALYDPGSDGYVAVKTKKEETPIRYQANHTMPPKEYRRRPRRTRQKRITERRAKDEVNVQMVPPRRWEDRAGHSGQIGSPGGFVYQ